jgi:6-pyruvoyltetrahydropterin/6-carboxytetrahydropterin synthase
VLGWTVDYGDVKRRFDPVARLLDHHRIDAIDGLPDASPAGLARWLRAQSAPLLPQLDRIDVDERPGCGAVLSWGDEAPAMPLG